MTRRAALSLLAPRRRIAVIAHRAGQPENTLAAIVDSIARAVDYVELDVRTTADGHFVLHHDADAVRTTTASGPIAELTPASSSSRPANPSPTSKTPSPALRPRAPGSTSTPSASPPPR